MLTGKLHGALYLGLDDENIRRLKEGKPIHIPPQRMATLGFEPMIVVIHYGPTQQDMLDEVARHGESLTQMDRG